MVDNPLEFAREWASSWNRRDIEAVLRHFDDSVVFTSPVAQRIGFAADGIVKGKDALRRYWSAALQVNPDLHFELVEVFAGIDNLVITYRNQHGATRAEMLSFNNALVVNGHGMFAAS